METYKIPNLNPKTPEAERAKLVAALQSVRGVASATLHPTTSEVELQAKTNQQPERSDISSALTKAGFPLTPTN